MRNLDKKVIIRLVIVIAITITGMTVLSIDLGIIPPLGSVLLPGNGIWQVQAEVPKEEKPSEESKTEAPVEDAEQNRSAEEPKE